MRRSLATAQRDVPPSARSLAADPCSAPDPELVNRFWKRVAELTSRYHDIQNNWTGVSELKEWNNKNRNVSQLFREQADPDLHAMQPCEKCIHSKTQRTCIIDEDHPSCRACRDVKIGCDRKPLFIFEMTRDEFFATYEEFIEVFHSRQKGQLRRLKQAENSFRSSPKSKDALSTRSKSSKSAILGSLRSPTN